MLKITPAMAEATAEQTADAYAAQAATRPLAGLGAGAFTCAGAWVGRGPAGIAASKPQARAVGVGLRTSVVDIVQVDFVQRASAQRDSVQRDIRNSITHNGITYNSIQTARPYPATGGGVGPHPAREPVPV